MTKKGKKRSKVVYLDNEINSDKLTDEITCKGCYNVFSSERVPKILHCLHTLCSLCITSRLKSTRDQNKVLCAVCKIECVGKNQDAFRTHSYVDILADVATCFEKQLNNTLLCMGCEKVAAHRCLTCNENYCQDHTDFHVRSRATSHHKVLTFKQILNAPLMISTIKREENCPKHTSKVLEFFCFSCKIPVCTACVISNHKSCIYEELSVAVGALKQKFDDLKPAYNRKHYNLNKSEISLNNGLKGIESDYSNTLTNVKDLGDKIIRQLRQKEAAIAHCVEDHRRDCQGEMRTHQALMEEKLDNIESGVDFVEKVFDYWSPLEVLTVENEIISRMNELTEEMEDFNIADIKPKPFNVPEGSTKTTIEAIKFLQNADISYDKNHNEKNSEQKDTEPIFLTEATTNNSLKSGDCKSTTPIFLTETPKNDSLKIKELRSRTPIFLRETTKIDSLKSNELKIKKTNFLTDAI